MYLSLRSQPIQGKDGKVRQVKKGDPVPEAASWKSVDYWIRSRRITDSDGKEYDGRIYGAAKHRGMVGAMRDKMEERATRPTTPVPEPVEPETTEPVSEAPESPVEPPPILSLDGLMEMTKAVLVDLAKSHDLETKGMSKTELAEAILGAE